MELIIYLIIGIVGVVLGFIISKILAKSAASSIITTAEKEAKIIIKEANQNAENIRKNKLLQAKEKFLELKLEHEKVIQKRDNKMRDAEKRLQSKESKLSQQLNLNNQKSTSLDEKIKDYDYRLDFLEKKQDELDKVHRKQVQQLEVLSGYSAEDAKAELIESVKEEAKADAMAYIQEQMEEAKLNAEKEARKIVLTTIQRVGVEQTVDNVVSVFNLESDNIKGRIIGREGRNIRALEAATGVEYIVDDTPEAIILSCFDPVRREIARLATHKLVKDGRIHPARVEEVVAKTKKQIDQEIAEVGKRTIIDLGIHGLHPELVKVVGRMKFRSSYGQNLLQHSREVANLCGIMAAELGLDAKVAKRAGLLHDIGKVPDEESELPHALLGMKWAEKYNEKPIVCNAIGAHHDEIEMKSLYAPIVQVCDAISGARPGARRQVLDSYIKRLKEMEDLAFAFTGVKKAYAIQAGRELRVIVESGKVTDDKAAELSFNISQKIQNEMTYPGQVRVTVIRETRAINIAK